MQIGGKGDRMEARRKSLQLKIQQVQGALCLRARFSQGSTQEHLTRAREKLWCKEPGEKRECSDKPCKDQGGAEQDLVELQSV